MCSTDIGKICPSSHIDSTRVNFLLLTSNVFQKSELLIPSNSLKEHNPEVVSHDTKAKISAPSCEVYCNFIALKSLDESCNIPKVKHFICTLSGIVNLRIKSNSFAFKSNLTSELFLIFHSNSVVIPSK
jgi:hypothetical protein